MKENELKRKLRDLKRLEIKLKYGQTAVSEPKLIWNSFFDLGSGGGGKYSLAYLQNASPAEFKSIIDRYWDFVCSQLFRSSDINPGFDKSLLLELDLPPDADNAAIKKRFRALALEYHPDVGGDAAKFIRLVEIYEQLCPH